jgi:hypothetical protein
MQLIIAAMHRVTEVIKANEAAVILLSLAFAMERNLSRFP